MVRTSPVHQWNGRFMLFPTVHVCGSYLEIESPTNSMDYKYLIWIRGCWFINGKSLVCDTPHNCMRSKRSREQTDHIVRHGVKPISDVSHRSVTRLTCTRSKRSRDQTDHVQRARARAQADKRRWVIGLWHASLVRAVNGAGNRLTMHFVYALPRHCMHNVHCQNQMASVNKVSVNHMQYKVFRWSLIGWLSSLLVIRYFCNKDAFEIT